MAVDPSPAPADHYQGSGERAIPGPRVIIKAGTGWSPLDLAGLWRSRGLMYFLVWRDLKVRYKQTVLGILWAILQPLLVMLVSTVIFGHFAKLPSDGAPYALFVYCALVPWTFFAQALSQSANSLVDSSHLIAKASFPRLVIPLAAALGAAVDSAVTLILLVCMLAIYGITPTLALIALPVFLLLALLAAMAVGIWLSALNVQYRDVRYTLPFLVQFWFYATPIVYPAGLITGSWAWILALNPLTGIIEGCRWSLIGAGSLDGRALALSVGIPLLLLVAGLYYFRRVERRFADVV
jgi:lipopolysaccharide transport system permease protein